jgi:hypothetical protein
MAEVSPGFSGFKITNYYKYILYVAGVILILSLFVPAQGVDNEKLRSIAFWVVMGGLSIWFLKIVFDEIYDYLEIKAEENRYSADNYVFWGWICVWIDYGFQIFVWVFLFFKFFKGL